MSRFHGGKHPISYVVFDILRYGSQDLRDLHLMERKAILDRALPVDAATISKTAFIDGRGEDLYEAIISRKMEGVVAKRKDGHYHAGKRTNDFLKVINYTYADVFLGGWRKGDFGWLAHVPAKDGRLRQAGIIELGVPPEHKKAFYGVAKSLITHENRDFVYIEPKLQARVKFRNWTKSGKLRSPVFVNFIMDQVSA